MAGFTVDFKVKERKDKHMVVIDEGKGVDTITAIALLSTKYGGKPKPKNLKEAIDQGWDETSDAIEKVLGVGKYGK